MNATGISHGFAQHDREGMGYTKGPVVREWGETIGEMVAIGMWDPRYSCVSEGVRGMVDNPKQIRVHELTGAMIHSL
jgi:hypothetical protein